MTLKPTRLVAVIATVALYSTPALPGVLAAESYIIVDNHTGHILEGDDIRDKRQVASLTKVATAMVVLDWAERGGHDLNQMAVVPPQAATQGGVNPLGLRPGEALTLRDLLYASLMQSDNVAAHTLAHHVGRTLPSLTAPDLHDLGPAGLFVAQMNALARSLGMERTLFLNPHGLDTEDELPHSTAADMARLARYAMNDSGFRFYVSQKERAITIRGPGGTRDYLLKNTNRLLGSGDIDGVKTGRTRRAGDCLILSAMKKPITRQEGEKVYVTPRRISVVLLGSRDRFAEGAALVQRGWQLYDQWAAQGHPVDRKNSL